MESVPVGYKKLLAEHTILCVLHAEMRINEKLINMLLRECLFRYDKSDSKIQKACIAAVTNCFQTVVLGSDEKGKRAAWKFQ